MVPLLLQLLNGKLSQCPSFPLDDITPDIIHSIKVHYVPDKSPINGESFSFPALITDVSILYWRQVIDPLSKIGRYDLVRAIEDKIEEFERHQERIKRKNNAKQFDHKFFGGILSKLNRLRKGFLTTAFE